MNIIIAILFRYLRGEAHYRFLSLFDLLLAEFPDVKAVVSSFYAEFSGLLALEKKIVDIQKSSGYTEHIVDADHRDDRLITGINSTLRAALHHFNPDIVNDARIVSLRMKAFGEIRTKSYQEEAAAIDLLVGDLRASEYAARVSRLGLTPWMDELSLAVADFRQLLKLRNIERSNKPQERLYTVRRQIEPVYRNMRTYINSAAILNKKDTFTTFINRLNTQIAYFNEHNHHPTPKNIRSANVDAIPVQQYAGKAVTPIPVVYLNGKELFFAKDFTLTYKNNTQPCTAEVIVIGKGDYTGRKKVTFNIVQA